MEETIEPKAIWPKRRGLLAIDNDKTERLT